MAYRFLPTKGGGYHRTGSRTPMQWDNSRNLGFSAGNAEDLYLPVDPNPGNATVEAQEQDPGSMLNHIRGILQLRREYADLGNCSSFRVYSAKEGSRLFAYKRGEMLLAVNPGLETLNLALDGEYTPVYTFGTATVEGKTATLGVQSFLVLKQNV